MDTTRELQHDASAPGAPASLGLIVAYHPDPARVGVHLRVEDSLVIGREPGLFDDETMSRRHARVARVAGGLTVEDTGSRNGTFVNGEPVERQLLRHGDVLGTGEIILLVLDEAQAARPPAAEIERLARLASPVLLVGETGVGKGRLAQLLHARSGRDPLVVLHGGALGPDRVAEELFGLDAAIHPPGRPGHLERAAGGTLLLDNLDDAPAPLGAALLAFLEQRAVGAAAVDVRILATARDAAALREDLVSRLAVVRVPPLRERPEDIPLLVRELLQPRGLWVRRALLQALLRHGFRHNVRELVAIVDRAIEEDCADGLVGLSSGVADALSLADVGSPGALAVAGDGTWFRPPGGARVSLANRDNLSRLLRALLEAYHQEAGSALSTETLFTAGWPGERIRGPAAAGRVYVALTTLRNLGLRHFLRRAPGGYLLDAKAKIESVS